MDEAGPRLDRQLGARLQDQVRPGLDVDLLRRVQPVVAANLVLSLARDIRILLMTLPAVFGRRGAF